MKNIDNFLKNHPFYQEMKEFPKKIDYKLTNNYTNSTYYIRVMKNFNMNTDYFPIYCLDNDGLVVVNFWDMPNWIKK